MSNRQIELDDLDGMLEHVLFSGYLEVSKHLFDHAGIPHDQVVNYKNFRKLKLVSKFLPENTETLVNFYDAVGRKTREIPGTLPKNGPFVRSVLRPQGGHIHVVGVDDTNLELGNLVQEVIRVSKPEHILLPMCPERSQIFAHNENDDLQVEL